MREERTYGVREIANWILDYADRKHLSITNMSLNKLAYFAYERALVQYGRKLTKAKIEAWEHGPVFREIYRSFKDFGDQPIQARAQLYDPVTDRLDVVKPQLAPEDEKIVEESIAALIRLPASVLRELSHDVRSPWAAVWNHEEPTNPGMQITDDLIRDCHTERGVRQ
jgi:uncharacterized phage-associated protein